jgi:hypothetical protein
MAVFADGSGGPGYKRGRRMGNRRGKIFSEKLWGSYFVVLIREMDARAALSEGGLGVFVRGLRNKNEMIRIRFCPVSATRTRVIVAGRAKISPGGQTKNRSQLGNLHRIRLHYYLHDMKRTGCL